MWEYRNGQWFNGPTPSPVGPPVGAPFWITDAAGNRDFRTFDGTNAPAATEVIPVTPFRNNVVPKPYGNDDIAINKTPPLVLLLQERAALPPEQQALWDADPKNIDRIAVARRMEAGLPPNPVTPPQPVTNLPPANPFIPKPKPQGIPGYTPPMTTSGGPLNQDRTSIFTPPSVTEPKQVNFTTQDMFGIDPNPYPLMNRFDGDTMFENPTGQILTNNAGNTFERNLLASIAEAVRSTNPTEAARARAVMNAVSNPAIVANYRGPATDLISQAGDQFDQERELARLKTERAAWQAGDVENMNYRARSAWEAGHPQPVEGETEEQKVARESRDKGPRENPFVRRRFDGTMPRYPTGTTPNIFDVVRAQRSGDPALASALTNQALGKQPNIFDVTAAQKSGRPDIAAAMTGSALGKGWNYTPPPPVTGAPRRSVAPVGSMYANNALPLNPFMRGTATATSPFVNRYAEGTWDPDWYNKALAIKDPKVRSKYVSEQIRLKSQMTPAQRAQARKPVIPAPVTTPVDWEALIKQKLDSGTLTHEDASAVHAAGNERLAQAITIKLTGGPWNYTWTPVTPPPAATTKPAVNPQVIWYGGDTWKNLPLLEQINNTQKVNPFSRLGSRSSYDPATETTLQAPEKMNAFSLMQVDRDPVDRDLAESIYNRHGRSWEKEYADAVRAAPMGNATRYVKTG